MSKPISEVNRAVVNVVNLLQEAEAIGPQKNNFRKSVRVITWEDNRMEVEVANRDSRAFQPNFFARVDWRTFPWMVLDGPVSLQPGESARYLIGTDLGYRNVSGYTGGQIVVSDGVAGSVVAEATFV